MNSEKNKSLTPEELAKRNAFRLLVKKINEVSSRNLGKTLFAFFFMAICEALLVSFLMMPLYSRFLKGRTDDSSLVLASVLTFASFTVWALFQFGFFSLLLRMVRGAFVTIGFVFLGYKKFKRSLPVSLFVAFLLTLVTAFALAATVLFTDVPDMLASSLAAQSDAAALQAFHFDLKALAVALGALALLLLFFFLFAFIFLAAYDGDGSSLAGGLKVNFRLLKSRRLLLFKLLLVSGGRFLLIALGAFGLYSLLSFTTDEKSLTMGKLVLNFVYLVNFYTALLRMYFVLPVLYEDARQPRGDLLIEDHSDSAVISDTIALLEHGSQLSDAAGDDTAGGGKDK